MPPSRSKGRAGKACSRCRKFKTRCYSSDSGTACLRCQTLTQPCSFDESGSRMHKAAPAQQLESTSGSEQQQSNRSIDERFQRLERLVENLADQLNNAPGSNRPRVQKPPLPRPAIVDNSRAASDPESAPVFFIRDAAEDAGVRSPDDMVRQYGSGSDVISSGLVSVARAKSLISLFRLHYGRWVKFPEHFSVERLLEQVRRSPLLLASVFLIAVRHDSQELADELAPKLFTDAKRLLTASLLDIPQPLEFFQATIILSLWSTTIGQVPLSIDSWLSTGYALQQAMASPLFKHILSGQDPNILESRAGEHLYRKQDMAPPLTKTRYCVGTRRHALLSQQQVELSIRLIESDNIDNFEARMMAEVKLYWIIYQHCSVNSSDLTTTRAVLEEWRQSWTGLFSQPRSQFLQMGFHFAYLLAYSQSLKAPQAVMDDSLLTEMFQRARSIIVLAMRTTDERARHLTDHIYHILTFAALTVCRLVQTYEHQLQQSSHDLASLDQLILDLINCLRSIGLPCHAAHILGHIISARFKEVRPSFWRSQAIDTSVAVEAPTVSSFDLQFPILSGDITLLYPDFIGSEFFEADTQIDWPQWC